MKMIDLGQKYDEPSVAVGGKDEKYYPTIYLNAKHMKAAGLSGKAAGTEIKMVAKVRIRSVSDSVTGGGSMDLEIVEASFEDGKKGDTATILYGKE